ncbi:hypothetical protein [Staphylococcus epidermidis]|uniref:hypothetical protein n=1 Tax=Staphylococcus epidermidis TaxID=1282 RepID=UPI00124C9B07|nr:hypothetical protein [Staphylococcus epidermidis]KAB2282586.1 hypothetical protein F9B71_02615 [Staphylococcus epidermidis]MCC2070205.1 hypothetical protein [Staphylococcus epidermidis]MCG2351848.1 hypothetical protein [Staphylococcus epidermidis]MDS3952604.1 hypothetical protein [Staphylococcus epidermidis]MDT0741521.1 hypothetical protein [Staphylococcus epidermidis]
MLILRKLYEGEQIIRYEYLPQDDIKNGKGEIVVNKLSSEVKEYSLSKIEINKNILTYRNKSFLAILDFIEEDKFPVKYFYTLF